MVEQCCEAGATQQTEMDRLPQDQGRSRWYSKLRFTRWCQDSMVRSMAKNLTLILIWYFLSTCLGLYNKKLVGKNKGIFGKGAFPAPLLMSAVQFMCQAAIAKLVFKLKLVERTAKPIAWEDYLKIVLPNGITTGLDIGFSNKSLVFITMSFYTMCKATVPVFLLFFAFIWRIERPSWELAGVVSIICAGLGLLVRGEAEFDGLGFALVMMASCLSGFRFTLTQISLHGHQDTVALGGPLEILELLTPVMSVTVMLLSVVWEQLWDVIPNSPYFSTLEHTFVTFLIILVGAKIAFLMVWTEYKVIKETSALTFMIAGTVKEVVTVVAAVIVMGDHFGVINGVGLVVVICGVLLFNWHKYQKMKQGEIPVVRGATRDKDKERLRDSPGSAVEMEAKANGNSFDASAKEEFEPLLPIPGVMVHR